ncbi:hypothetical protein [Alkalihalobacillus deserti]|uniref:hypothetical protein n=1 Tax=Alkalihalobacillus deserti TaxID=2879466 RepID=UPI001D134D46|nr:hypothetical protein [Alkalihalobacillus deserti]
MEKRKVAKGAKTHSGWFDYGGLKDSENSISLPYDVTPSQHEREEFVPTFSETTAILHV